MFLLSGRCARDLKVWLENEAEAARSNEGLARRFVEECRRRQVILPGLSVLERLGAGALVAAERRIETRIAAGLDDAMRLRLDRLLTTGCLPPAAYHRLLTTGCLPPAAYHRLLTTGCLPPAAYHRLLTTGCLPPAAYHRLLTTGCLPPAAYHRLLTTGCLPPAAYHRLLTTGCLPPAAYHRLTAA